MKITDRELAAATVATSGADLDRPYTMDSSEAREWIGLETEFQYPFFEQVFGYLSCVLPDHRKAAFDRLLEKQLGEPSLDDMAELRDHLRALLINAATEEIVSAARKYRNRRAHEYDDEQFCLTRYAVAL